MRVTLRVEQAQGGANAKDTLKAFDDLVNSKFYGQAIEEESLRPYVA
jgi:hypothetical protein